MLKDAFILFYVRCADDVRQSMIVDLALRCAIQKNVKCAIPNEDCRRGAHLPFLGREPVVDEPLKSVTHGQCDARPTVTFPAAGHHRPLTGTNHTAW